MKTHRFFPVAASLFLVASPLPVSAGVEVDILSIDPRNPRIVLLQIDLNEALKQYEKALAQWTNLKLASNGRPDNTGLTAEQIKIRDKQLSEQREMVDYNVSELRVQITKMLEEAQQHAKVLKKNNLEAQVKQGLQSKGVAGIAPDPAALLQGKWEGREAGREAAGKCTLEVKGDTVHFQGANPQEWYKATFVLPVAAAQPAGQPRQLRATITQCSVPDMVGQTSMAIYTLEEGTLTLVANKPGFPHPPKTFEGDPESRSFSFKQLVEH